VLWPGESHVPAPPVLRAGCAVMPRCGCRTCRCCSDGSSHVDVLERHFPTAPIGGRIWTVTPRA